MVLIRETVGMGYCYMTHTPPISTFYTDEDDTQSLSALASMTQLEKDLGRITPQGKVITVIDDINDLGPSQRRVIDFLYQHTETTLNNATATLIGHPNRQQLVNDVIDLRDCGIIDVVVHNEQQVMFLTPKGEDLVDNDVMVEDDHDEQMDRMKKVFKK